MCKITHQQNSHLDLGQLALEEENWSSSALPYLVYVIYLVLVCSPRNGERRVRELIPISDLIVLIELFSIDCKKKSEIAVVFFISNCDWSRKPTNRMQN